MTPSFAETLPSSTPTRTRSSSTPTRVTSRSSWFSTVWKQSRNMHSVYQTWIISSSWISGCGPRISSLCVCRCFCKSSSSVLRRRGSPLKSDHIHWIAERITTWVPIRSLDSSQVLSSSIQTLIRWPSSSFRNLKTWSLNANIKICKGKSATL